MTSSGLRTRSAAFLGLARHWPRSASGLPGAVAQRSASGFAGHPGGDRLARPGRHGLDPGSGCHIRRRLLPALVLGIPLGGWSTDMTAEPRRSSSTSRRPCRCSWRPCRRDRTLAVGTAGVEPRLGVTDTPGNRHADIFSGSRRRLRGDERHRARQPRGVPAGAVGSIASGVARTVSAFPFIPPRRRRS